MMRFSFLRSVTACLGAAASVLLPGCHNSAPAASAVALSSVSAPTPPVASMGSGAVRFADVATQAGLKYHWTAAGKRPLNILQTIGNGCAFLDYNGDGNLDILLVGPHLALYKGDGKGHFADVTHDTGLDTLSGHFLGCAVGDYDNDGYDDVYISGYRTGILLHNEPNLPAPFPARVNKKAVDAREGGEATLKGSAPLGQNAPLSVSDAPPSLVRSERAGKGAGGLGRIFRDVTQQAGLKPQPWGTSCSFADIDGDGKLDLYVCNYAQFSANTKEQLCLSAGFMTACGPRFYLPEQGVIYRNEGGGRFRDVTASWGGKAVHGKALGVAAADYDGSGRQSFALANDEMPGDLLQNLGRRFRQVGAEAGTSYDNSGGLHGGMGTDWGDYDNDGKLDMVVATYEHEAKNVYHNEGEMFNDRSDALGIAGVTTPYVAFGVKFFDADNDGFLDLVFTNGHVQDNIDSIDHAASYRQPILLLRNEGGTAFSEVGTSAGEAFGRKIVGRGLAVGDYDNDGKDDLLVVDSEGSPLLLHNESPHTGHWLTVRLIGAKSNRDGIGALVTFTSQDGKTRLRRCATDGSYLSASDRRVHCGLNKAETATVTVKWSSGTRSVLQNVKADQIVTIREGK